MIGAMPSPCIGICKMTDDGSLCVGCARTADEIAQWSALEGEAKLTVFRDLPRRRAASGLGVPVLGHPVAALDRLILGSLDDRGAVWRIGVPGAFGEFNLGDGSVVTARLWEYGGDAISGRGGVRVVLDHTSQKIKMIGQTNDSGVVERIDLCLYTRKAAMSHRSQICEIGLDTEALRTGDRRGTLFDLGLGLPHVDFCVRVEEASLLDLLRAHCGTSLLDPASPVLEAIRQASPQRVLLTRMGRVEAWTPLPGPGEPPLDGPHTHLDLQALAEGATRPADSPVPATLYPVISLFPRQRVALAA
ncbi:DUF1289 domain-containing protein [Rhodospirillum rubrum]|uniref:DUF1289 domain-containing protein n=2 Tax=Rhodospirillum rubrum TaxID=1085 RepID=UPI00190464F6|nr:DUF1289 domain-containing protein [Rhodospirillum rubrum]MBK1665168.1 DUF1289 domain-containing protein [Rhodospirillum rubrum]MBK1676789.1 DUF1289 domain-containing protein [Rhodospirillum rubrum]